MCQKCLVPNCKRDNLQNARSTAFSRLRKDEQLLFRSRPLTIQYVAQNLIQLGYGDTIWGEENCCDFQAVKRYGLKRYHYRVYEYPNTIVVESHIDAIDPSQDPLSHIGEVISHRLGIEKESNHHVIVFVK